MGNVEPDKIGVVWELSDIQLTNSKMLRIRKVLYRHEYWIDIRHWVRFRGEDFFRPTKKGAFLSAINTRDKLIPLLKEWTEKLET